MQRAILLAAIGLVLALSAFVVELGPADPFAPSPDSPPRPKNVRPVGIMVNAPTAASSIEFEDLAFLGTFAKTQLALEIVRPQGGLIELLRDRSTVDRFVDDRGTDLLADATPFGPIDMLTRVAEDQRSLVFALSSAALPDGTARRLEASGEVALMVATETETHRSPGVTLSRGTTFAAGPYRFEITDAGESDWSDGWSVTLSTRDDPTAVLRYAAVVDGEELELTETMTVSGGETWHKTLECEVPIEKVEFLLECWRDPEVVELPFEVSVGLGLR